MRRLLLLAVLAALPACAPGPRPAADTRAGVAAAGAKTALDLYPLRAETANTRVRLAPHDAGLSPTQKLALEQISGAAGSRQSAVIAAPAQSDAARLTASQARDYLISIGFPAQSVTVIANPDDATVIVDVALWRAHVYDCGKSFENLAATRDNLPYANFGCAYQSNLAAEIADPSELTHPQALGSGDAARRAMVFDKYRRGQSTSSQTDENASGKVSSAVQ